MNYSNPHEFDGQQVSQTLQTDQFGHTEVLLEAPNGSARLRVGIQVAGFGSF